MDPIYSFGEWTKRRRKAVGLTQRELAERAHCATVTIKKIEADQRRPSVELAGLLAELLALPHDQVQVFIECARGRRPVDQLDWALGAKTPDASASNLPAAGLPPLPVFSTPLIGRDAELELLRQMLLESWLVTIVGVGGIGKTRLALGVADKQHRAGQATVFVSLAHLKPDDNLAAAIIESLGLPLLTGSDPTGQLLGFLWNKDLLLVLDNFEHLLANAGLLSEMRQAAPELKILVTSRERLRLAGEQLLPLQGLEYPRNGRLESRATDPAGNTQYPAAQLFLSDARRLMPSFTPVDDDALLELCRITDGLPLALELAAAWVGTLTLPDLVEILSQNLDLLTLDSPNRPARHYSIRAAFDTTWHFLGDVERDAFSRLSVFSGGFTRTAAESIAGISLATLSTLVGRHLVQLDHDSGRYTLHELMRQYAADKRADDPDLDYQVHQRHAAFMREFLVARESDLRSDNQEKVLAEIRDERANIWTAWQWATLHPEETLLDRAIAPLGQACQLNNWVADGYTLFTHSARSLSGHRQQTSVLGSLLHLQVWRARFVTWLGRPADSLLAEIQQLLAKIKPSPELRPILALYHLAAEEALRDVGDRDAARSHAKEALALYESLDDEWGLANAMTQLGTVCWNVGEYDEALTYFEESLTMRRKLGDRRGEAYSLDRLGLLLQSRGEMEQSCQYLEQAIKLFRTLGDRSGLADASENLGSAWLEMGRFEDAHRQYGEVAILYDELGLRHTGYTVLKALTAFASAHLGDYQRAAEEASEAVALSRELGHKRSEGLALIALGLASLALDNDAAAGAALIAGTKHLREINQLEELTQGIGLQALVAHRQGDFALAKQYVVSGLAIIDRLRGLPSSPDYPLAVWALLLSEQGESERAAAVYQLVLAEPFGAASRWFDNMFGRFFSNTPPPKIMPLEERWAAISRLYRSLK